MQTVGLIFHHGNAMHALADALAASVAAARGPSLRPTTVLIAQAAQRRFLERALIARSGIVANVDFELAPRWLDALAVRSVCARPGDDFALGRLAWRIAAQLPTLAARPAFAAALQADDGGLHHYALSQQMQRLYADYQLYRRPLWVRHATAPPADDWQAVLWQQLVAEADTPPPAVARDAVLRNPDRLQLDGVDDTLYVFAGQHLAPDYLRVLARIATRRRVEFFAFNPSEEYWIEGSGREAMVPENNPLLAAFARTGRDFYHAFFSYALIEPEAELSYFDAPPGTSLLAQIQRDVLHDRSSPNDRGEPVAVAVDDRSVQVFRCHCALREVEVLHDQLLALLQDDPTLTPRDIVVMAPRIGDYSEAIHAVFGALSPADPRRLPYSLSDRDASAENPSLALGLAVVELPVSRIDRRLVLDLLAQASVRAALQLSSDDLDRLESWLTRAGAFVGLDGADRAGAGAGADPAYSFAEAIERLLLGYAMGDVALNDQLDPVAGLGGQDSRLFGILLDVLAAIRTFVALRQAALPLQAWLAALRALLDTLLPPAQTQDQSDVLALHRALCDLARDSRDYAAPLRHPTFAQAVRDALAGPGSRPLLLSRGISFCGLLGQRALPFRVVALLGLNENDFPRPEPALALDQIAVARRLGQSEPGDRAVREDDRYVFLQAVLSARDALLISYQGFDRRTGDALEPSAVLREFLDLLGDGYFPDRASALRQLQIDAPLAPHSPRHYDSNEPRLHSFSPAWRVLPAAAPTPVFFTATKRRAGSSSTAAIEPAGAITPVRLSELISIFENPAKHYLSTRFGLSLPSDWLESATHEPLARADVPRARLLADLLELPSDASDTQLTPAMRQRLALPTAGLGAALYADTQQLAQAFAVQRDAMRGSEPAQTTSIALDFPASKYRGAVQLSGQISHAPKRVVAAITQHLSGKRLIAPRLQQIALNAAGVNVTLELIYLSKKNGLCTHTVRAMQPEKAQANLRDLLDRAAGAGERLLRFTPDSAFFLAAAQDAYDDKVQRAIQEFRGGFVIGERERDPWIRLAYRDADPFNTPEQFAKFLDNAKLWFGQPSWNQVRKNVS